MINGAHVIIYSRDAEADRRVELSAPEDRGWGVMSTISLPGGGQLGLYRPRHPTAFDL